MNCLNYYAKQSEITHPAGYTRFLDELPEDIGLLSEITRGLILHHNDGEALGYSIPKCRLKELELRYVKSMLDKIIGLNQQSLIYRRDPAQRLLGCCRDFSILLCAFLRHKEIPARVRVGFTTFHFPAFHHDQVMLEYWNFARQKWCLVDARMTLEFMKKYNLAINFDLLDVPRDKFITSAEAWILCRNAQKDPKQFGAGFFQRMSGWWYIRNKLIQDIAALNKQELLLWDCWGMMLKDSSDVFMNNPEQVERLDYYAELLYEADLNFEEIKLVYHLDSNVTVPSRIYSAGVLNDARWVELNNRVSVL